MRKELDEKLCKEYPLIFKDRHGDKTKTVMYWGVECGDGWYDLLDRLCARIQYIIDEYNKKHGTQATLTVVQIKEKFGSLRFYYWLEGLTKQPEGSRLGDVIFHLVQFANDLSASICEECGDKATVRTEGWIKNLCRNCYKER